MANKTTYECVFYCNDEAETAIALEVTVDHIYEPQTYEHPVFDYYEVDVRSSNPPDVDIDWITDEMILQRIEEVYGAICEPEFPY